MTAKRAFINNLFIFQSLANVLCFTQSWREFVLQNLWKQLNLWKFLDTLIRSRYRKMYEMNIVFIWHFFSSYHGLLSRRPIRSTAIPGNIDIRIKTRDAFRAAKICKNGTYKVFDEWFQSSFSKFLSLMPDVSLIRYTTINNGIKESASWFHLKWMLVITDSIKVNKSCTPSRTFWGRFEFGSLWEQNHYV